MHTVSIAEASGDSADTYGARAFCDVCPWAGEWHHAEPAADLDAEQLAEGEAYNAAQAEGEEHAATA